MLSFERLSLANVPFPHGAAEGVFEPLVYKELAYRFPPRKLFAHMGGVYEKYSLSERNHPEQYSHFIMSNPCWSEFHCYIKGGFITDTLKALDERGVCVRGARSARFEFSDLPADGGRLEPHRDIASKLVTVVLPMRFGGWDEAWGGTTDILRPVDPEAKLVDYQVSRSAFETVAALPYRENCATVFVKTDNSWHAVGPIRGPKGAARRSLTLNIEGVA